MTPMKSIKEYQKEQIGKVIGNYFKLGWVFDKWYEKVILVIIGWLALWKVVELIEIELIKLIT